MTLKKYHELEQKLENYLNQIGIISDVTINKKNLISDTDKQKSTTNTSKTK